MKKRWYLIEAREARKGAYSMTTFLRRQAHARSINKTLGEALLLIDVRMGGELYVIQPPLLKEDHALLIAEGRRGGYPEQPATVTVDIREMWGREHV